MIIYDDEIHAYVDIVFSRVKYDFSPLTFGKFWN